VALKAGQDNPLARGRWLRGIAAWGVAVICAALVAASLAVAFLLAQEHGRDPAFGAADYWVFLNLWRPMALAGAALTLVFATPLAAMAVALIRRAGWPRPGADIACGAVCGPAAVLAVALTFNLLFNFGE
jgi:hypothetical protein